MTDTVRSSTDLLALFADGQGPAEITPQDMRDLIVTFVFMINALQAQLDTYTPPDPGLPLPTALTITDASAGFGTAYLEWAAPPPEEEVSEIRLTVSDGDPINDIVEIYGTDVTSYLLTDLSEGTNLTFTLQVFNASGEGTAATATVTTVAKPDQQAPLTVDAVGEDFVDVSFTQENLNGSTPEDVEFRVIYTTP